MKRRAVFQCAGAGALSLACAQAAAAPVADASLAQAVERANTDWLIAMQTGNARAIAAPYAVNAVFTLADGTCIVGREAIEKMYRSRFEQKGLAGATSIDSKRLETDGDLAYEWGSATVHLQGQATAGGGRYLTVWQRQADGEWQIARNLVFPADVRV